MECPPPNVIEALTPRTVNLRDCVTVRSMVNTMVNDLVHLLFSGRG